MKISTSNQLIRVRVGDIPALRMIREAGFDGIDYGFFDMSPDNDILELPDVERERLAYEIRNEAEKLGLSFPQSHAELKYGWGAWAIKIDEEDWAYRRILRGMEYASRIGCRQIVIHTVRCPKEMPQEEIDRFNTEFMRSFIPYAERWDLLIGIENLFRREAEKGVFSGRQHTAESMNRFVDGLGSDRFRVCVDTGHAALCRTKPEDLIRGLSPDRLTMLHIQDNDLTDDRHLLPYLGELEWKPVTDALREIGYRGSLNFEALKWMKKFPTELFPAALRLLAETARLMADEIEKG